MKITTLFAAIFFAANAYADTPNMNDLVEIIPEKEIECLARNIYFESRGEDIKGHQWFHDNKLLFFVYVFQ
jgi:hypothetical protein